MKVFRFLLAFTCLSLLPSCSKDTPEPEPVDQHAWLDMYTGDFKFKRTGTFRFSDGFAGAPSPPQAINDSVNHAISRQADNIIIEGSKVARFSWTKTKQWKANINENKEFSFSWDTAYINKCNGCGSGHHVYFKIALAGSFFSQDSLKYSYEEKAGDASNGTASTVSATMVGVRVK